MSCKRISAKIDPKLCKCSDRGEMIDSWNYPCISRVLITGLEYQCNGHLERRITEMTMDWSTSDDSSLKRQDVKGH